MQYRALGNTDLKVSLLALGTMTFGEQNTQQEAFEQLDYASSCGVNLLDVAEAYPIPPKPETQGLSETIVGEWLAARGNRHDIVVATKVTGSASLNSGVGHIRQGPRLSAQQIVQAVDGSLARLQTDYIDLYQLHWPERYTNFFGRLGYEHMPEVDGIALEESINALNDCVKAGKIRHIGLSNETPWGVMESCRLADKLGVARVASVQNPYNLLNRTYEVGLAEISIREKVSLLAYSPLAFGVLSGKYLDGKLPAGSRMAITDRFTRYKNQYAQAAIAAYVALAKEHGIDPVHMALAFVNTRQFMTANIIGATTMEQLKHNIDSLSVDLSDELLAGISDIHQQYSNPAP